MYWTLYGDELTAHSINAAVARGSSLASLRARVPDADFGRHALDGLRVGIRQLHVRPLLYHQELDQTRRAAKRLRHLAVCARNRGHTLRLPELDLQVGFGLFDRRIVGRVRLGPDLVRLGLGALVGRVEAGPGFSLHLVRLGVGGLLLGLARDGRPHDIMGAESLHLGRGALDLDLALQLFVLGLGRALGLDLRNVHVATQHRLARREASLGRGLLAVALRLLDGRLGVDLGDLALLLALALRLADVALELGLGDVDACLVGRALVGLSREGLEVAAVGRVAEFLDVGVVNLEAELVELTLNVAEDAALWLGCQ